MKALFDQFGASAAASAAVVMLFTIAGALTGIRSRLRGLPVVTRVARLATVGSVVLVLAATALPYSWPIRWERLGDLVLRLGGAGLGGWKEVREAPVSLASLLLLLNIFVYIPVALFWVVGWESTR